MLIANFFAAASLEKPASLANPEVERTSLRFKLLIAFIMLTATLWQASGTTLAQDSTPAASETEMASADEPAEVTDAENTTEAEAKAVGLDEQIDKAFKPIADFLSLIHI